MSWYPWAEIGIHVYGLRASVDICSIVSRGLCWPTFNRIGPTWGVHIDFFWCTFQVSDVKSVQKFVWYIYIISYMFYCEYTCLRKLHNLERNARENLNKPLISYQNVHVIMSLCSFIFPFHILLHVCVFIFISCSS